MRKSFSLFAFSLVLTAQVAQACTELRPLDFQDLQYAATVVVGRVENYHIVPDENGHQRRRALLTTPDLSTMLREGLARQDSIGTDYARFDVVVDEVLIGRPVRSFSAVWDSVTLPEPKQIGAGPFLIALYDPNSPTPADYSFGDDVSLSRKLALLTVLQAPCTRAYFLDANSRDARGVRRFLKGRKP